MPGGNGFKKNRNAQKCIFLRNLIGYQIENCLINKLNSGNLKDQQLNMFKQM